MQTVVCSRPGCPLEAAAGSEFCVDHQPATRKDYGFVSAERAALAERVRVLRDEEGLLYREIVDRLGISYSYAQSLYTDPDGAKARTRKNSYRQPCPRCGGPMTGSDGRSGAPGLCADCSRRAQHDDRFWTAERIVETFRLFHDRYGRSPSVLDTGQGQSPSQRRNKSAVRLADADRVRSEFMLPHAAVVAREFGSWKDALAAAGLPANPTGAHAHRDRRQSAAVQGTLAILADGPARAGDIAAARDVTIHSVRMLLATLARRGQIIRLARGLYTLNPDPPTILTGGGTPMAREYMVLRQNGVDDWAEISTVDALTPEHAIEKVADTAGTYVAVDARTFQPVQVGPVTSLKVIREAVPA